jgi:hypothetical protein
MATALDVEVEETVKIEIDTEMLLEFARASEEKSQVIVHVTMPPQYGDFNIRIWRSTFLLSRNSEHKSRLLHAENISIAPIWTEVHPLKPYTFTLIFEGLSKEVLLFDLAEIIPQPGGFFYPSILRNNQDIYHITLNS